MTTYSRYSRVLLYLEYVPVCILYSMSPYGTVAQHVQGFRPDIQ